MAPLDHLLHYTLHPPLHVLFLPRRDEVALWPAQGRIGSGSQHSSGRHTAPCVLDPSLPTVRRRRRLSSRYCQGIAACPAGRENTGSISTEPCHIASPLGDGACPAAALGPTRWLLPQTTCGSPGSGTERKTEVLLLLP